MKSKHINNQLAGWSIVFEKDEKQSKSAFEWELKCRNVGYREDCLDPSKDDRVELAELPDELQSCYELILERSAKRYKRTGRGLCVNLMVVVASIDATSLKRLKQLALVREWPNRCLEPVIFHEVKKRIHSGTPGEIS